MNNVYLIGCRGVGKTTVAPLLANKMGRPVVEMDQRIVESAGMSVSQIFKDRGEAAFRDLESAVLHEVASASKQVVSTGGGIVVRPENRELLRSSGQVIWLTATLPVMHERLRQSDGTRPPLTSLSWHDEIEQMAERRAPFYSAIAHFTVDTGEQNLEDSVSIILTYLSRVSPHGYV